VVGENVGAVGDNDGDVVGWVGFLLGFFDGFFVGLFVVIVVVANPIHITCNVVVHNFATSFTSICVDGADVPVPVVTVQDVHVCAAVLHCPPTGFKSPAQYADVTGKLISFLYIPNNPL
jgi:hypothetical protein